MSVSVYDFEKLLTDYCAKHELPTPEISIKYGTYGGKIGVVRIGDKTYIDDHERQQSSEAINAAVLIAMRDILKLNN
jgi:hypothetical protein